jgi:hypothetical protein
MGVRGPADWNTQKCILFQDLEHQNDREIGPLLPGWRNERGKDGFAN